MNPAQLLAQFDRIGEAPDAIPRLRRFILDLAVRGNLVEQDSRDEPAFELIKRIQTEKARLVKERKIGKQEPFEPIEELEIPFQIPQTWEWVPATFPTYLISDMGKKIQTKEVLESGDLPVVDQGKVFIRGYCNDRNKVIHIDAPIVLFGDHTRETKLINFDFVVGADGVKLLHPVCILTDYYYLALKWLPLDSRGYGRHFKLLKAATLPLPPLAEQHRIVAKVDELMALCDRLEAAQTEQESRRDRLVASSLHHLNNGVDVDAFREHARFYFNHLSRLTTCPEHLKKLRGTVLSLAFRGQLTSRWRETVEIVETAEDFLLSVENARKKTWDHKQAAGSSRKFLSPIEFDRKNLPMISNSWVWASADAVCSQITDGEHIQPRYQAEGLPMLTAKHVREGFVTFEGSELISESDFRKCVARCKPEEGDILVVSVGATTGRAAIVSQSRPFALVRSVLLLKPLISPAYFLRWLQSPWCFAWMRQASEASAQPHLYIGDTKRMPVPLPPLAEQHRIVAKVDELMALCDQLEIQLTTTQSESRHLLEAILHHALSA